MIKEIFDNDVLWQMSLAEKATLLYFLSITRRNSIAVEVGSYKGGFTQHLSRHFKKVYSLDIDHSNIANKDKYKNVEWVTGDSAETFPWVMNKLMDKDISFCLIDADHSYNSVLRDINNFIEYKPITNTLLFMHDSWYYEAREAINHANWNNNPFIHVVEKDLVSGDLIYPHFVGGLALAYLSNFTRKNDLIISQYQDFTYSKVKQLIERELFDE